MKGAHSASATGSMGRSNSGGNSASNGSSTGSAGANVSNLPRPNSFTTGVRPPPPQLPPRPGVHGPELMIFDLPSGRERSGTGGGKSEQTTRADREKEVEEKVQTAKDFIKNIEDAAAKDQDAQDAAKVKHDAKLTAWAEDHGKKRNVRTLLSTMHLVLWERNQWKTVSMGDIIQPARVKLAYRKAMLTVHPDKCVSLGPEERLIAKRVFEAVNEAYTTFQEKEMS